MKLELTFILSKIVIFLLGFTSMASYTVGEYVDSEDINNVIYKEIIIEKDELVKGIDAKSITIRYGGNVYDVVSSIEPTKEGYDFIGWLYGGREIRYDDLHTTETLNYTLSLSFELSEIKVGDFPCEDSLNCSCIEVIPEIDDKYNDYEEDVVMGNKFKLTMYANDSSFINFHTNSWQSGAWRTYFYVYEDQNILSAIEDSGLIVVTVSNWYGWTHGGHNHNTWSVITRDSRMTKDLTITARVTNGISIW